MGTCLKFIKPGLSPNILALCHSKAVSFTLCSFVILGCVGVCFPCYDIKPYPVPLGAVSSDCVLSSTFMLYK